MNFCQQKTFEWTVTDIKTHRNAKTTKCCFFFLKKKKKRGNILYHSNMEAHDGVSRKYQVWPCLSASRLWYPTESGNTGIFERVESVPHPSITSMIKNEIGTSVEITEDLKPKAWQTSSTCTVCNLFILYGNFIIKIHHFSSAQCCCQCNAYAC